jgi:hypothetical protein
VAARATTGSAKHLAAKSADSLPGRWIT